MTPHEIMMAFLVFGFIGMFLSVYILVFVAWKTVSTWLLSCRQNRMRHTIKLVVRARDGLPWIIEVITKPKWWQFWQRTHTKTYVSDQGFVWQSAGIVAHPRLWKVFEAFVRAEENRTQ